MAVFVLPVNAAINPMMYTLVTTPYVRRALLRARTSLAQTSYSMSMDTKHTNLGAGMYNTIIYDHDKILLF